MTTSISINTACGHCLALGMAWHLDNGFWSIFFETLLGWIYVAYKITEKFWPI